MIEVSSGPKGINILWDNKLEVIFKEFKRMVSSDTVLNYPN